jgi:hypothetical protein
LIKNINILGHKKPERIRFIGMQGRHDLDF